MFFLFAVLWFGMAVGAVAAVGETGKFVCPVCDAGMVPLKGKAAGKGFACETAGWTPKRGPFGCKGIVWTTAGRFAKKKEVVRPAAWRTLKNRTEQQNTIRGDFGTSPEMRGGRLQITDAGPGT